MNALNAVWQWFGRSWQLLLLWIISLTLLAATLAAVYAPLPTNVSASDSAKLRQAALPLFGSGFVAVFIFTFQTTRARLERRHEALRSGCRLLLGAVQTILDVHRELKNFPKGHPTTPPGVTPVELGNFDRANELDQEWRRLYREGELDVILEEGPDGPTLAAWRTVRDSYWAWVDAQRESIDLPGTEAITKAGALATTLSSDATAFAEHCHRVLGRLG